MKKYKRLTYRFQNAIEVYEYLDGRYGARGAPRKKKRAVTPEEVENRNQWNRERKARHLLRKYYKKNDYFSDFTYKKEMRPVDLDEAKEHLSSVTRIIRREYRKRGEELRWMANIEVGTKNAWHIHICINRIPDTDIILAGAWAYGHVTNKLMYEMGEFADLAKYITKTPKTDSRLKASRFSRSRNMPLPEPEKEVVNDIGEPKEEEGFYLEKETFHEGDNSFTGYKYRYYTLLRLKPLPKHHRRE